MTAAGPAGAGIGEVLRSAGAVGHDLLAVDWSAVPIGPPERWPRSLQTMVAAVLTSRFSMWMAWGPELTFFCNDAYRRDTLGEKYPWALGRSAREVWAEIWPDIGPRIGAVMRTGTATWDEALLLFLERSGFAEETYHTFSYSPLAGDDGRISGMLCVVTEDTERVIGARRMATLRDLGSDPAGARSEADVLAAACGHLERNRRDLPFTLTYLFEQDGTARLAASTGIPRGHRAAVETLAPGAREPWPAAALAGGVTVVVDLDGLADVPAGEWEIPPAQAIVTPLPEQGQARPAGFLVAAASRYRPLDGEYRAFIALVAGQMAAGIGSARAYESERRRAEELAELDRAKTAFFTNVSHELRTPLTLLLGPADDALSDAGEPLPDAQRARVELMARNAQRLLKLVNTLLDFSRLQSGRASAAFEPVDLLRYTAELSSMFESAVERAGLELRCEGDPLPEAVYVDREMWAKIVLNLLSNALKFTFEGSIAVRVEAAEDGARLTVSDTGIGIEPAEQPRLFERFHRVPGGRSRTYEGSGIGLALVAELAEVHGGTTGVRSAPGEGSSFRVTVPFGTGHLPADQVSSTPRSLVSAERQAEDFLAEAMRWLEAGDGGGADAGRGPGADAPRVLVADDNADMRDYVSSLLGSRYVVETAPDGAAALERARADPPDLVLTDVMMPELDGFGLLAALRADPATVGVPVIMVSARAGEDGTIEGLEAGADDYLVKPFGARELLARVGANLELDRARRTRDQLERSQALLDQAQRLARVGSWEIELATGAIAASDELARQLGMSAAELRKGGLDAALTALGHAHDAPRVRTALDAAARGAALVHEVRVELPSGDVRWFRVLGELERDGDGTPARLRGSAQDITEQRAAEQALAALAVEREAAAHERRIAEELQHSLLPERTFDPDHLEVATFYQAGVAGTQVGGDWFDVIEVGAGRTALVVGDVMGRGVRAAAVMGQLRSAVRAYARLDLAPADVLEFLDAVVRDLGEQIVTCVYAVFDPSDRTLIYASAGHLPPLVAAPGEPVRRLTGAVGPPLGAGPMSIEEERVELPVGAVLALYTDGLVERRGRGVDVGIDELAERLGSASETIDELPAALMAALMPQGSDDDVAVLAAKVPGELHPAAERLSLAADPPAIQDARGFTARTLGAWELPAALVRDAVLLVSEMVTNAILYGRPPIELRLRQGRDHVLIEVDDGATAVPRKLRPRPEDLHGRGLQLVAMLADEWGTRPLADAKSVWCALSFARYSAADAA